METKDILILLNPQWQDRDYYSSKEIEDREYNYQILKYLPLRQIVCLSGLRRTGKTSSLFWIIKYLIKEKSINPEHILYFTFDEKVNEIKDFLDVYEGIFSVDINETKICIFLDEIQKLPDWQNKLKIFYDRYPKVKFFISGSSSLEISRKGKETLAGRMFYVKVKPLTLPEWLKFKKADIKIEGPNQIPLYHKKAKSIFEHFLKTTFPEIVDFEDDFLIREYIKTLVLDRVIYQDIPKEFKNVQVDLLETILDLVYGAGGFYLNYDNLSRGLKRGKKTIISHIRFLENSLLISLIKNFKKSSFSSSRKLKKVYPYHPALTINSDLSRIVENFFIFMFDGKFYFREKDKEVDIVIKDKNIILPIEIKYKNKLRDSDFKNLFYFLKYFDSKKGFLISQNEFYIKKEGEVKIYIYPAWYVALRGKTLLESVF